MSATTTLIIGVGTEYRGDDGAGLVVARMLRARALPRTRVVEHSGEVAALIDTWRDSRQVIVIDAAHAQGIPGTIYRIEAHAAPLPARLLSHSTHDLGVAEAIELARLLDGVPERLVVYAIEGREFAVGAALSASVARACHAVAARVAREVCHIAAHGEFDT